MTTETPGQAPDGGEDPRLASLDARLDAAKATEAQRTGEAEVQSQGALGQAIGQRVAATLLGYPIGGAIIGWLIDGWLGTRPWVMLVLMFMAFAAACLDVFRVTKNR